MVWNWDGDAGMKGDEDLHSLCSGRHSAKKDSRSWVTPESHRHSSTAHLRTL